uniref:glycine N-acyltransferase-like protein 3 isoform X2 n=1 Tax=Pristiophorus japonicus TaxID=55135 RepID=UPI00398EE871
MKMFLLLTKEKLLTLEKALRNYLPAAIKTYGTILNVNKGKIHDLEVVVDSWPDFNAVICRPGRKVQSSCTYNYSVFQRSEQFAQTSYGRQCCRLDNLFHVWRADVASRISHLDLTHAQIVSRNWKFGNDTSLEFIENVIANFPNYCILDETDNPVSWLLSYNYGAMGLLYTLPEHRRKGYAKLLVATMVKTLQNLGYPIYCFIEEENDKSYQLFEKLGFKESPGIRFAWQSCRPFER